MVHGCLMLDAELDRRFHEAWAASLARFPSGLRGGALAGVTGHVAESAVELLLVEWGYAPLEHHPGPGRHGVDLLMLHLASDMVFGVEVNPNASAEPHSPPDPRRARADDCRVAG